MRYLPVACLLLASSMWGQQELASTSGAAPAYQPPQDDDHQALPASASKVGSDAAVITIKGFCEPPSPASGENRPATCQLQFSRAQFEKLADAVLTHKQISMLRQLAESYPNLLAMAQAAETRGLDKKERVQQRLAFTRLQILSQELVRQIDEDSESIPNQEIEGYYHSHSAEFETATLERIYIPSRKAELQQVAEKLRARAVAGESFLTLQKEAYIAAEMTDVPPNPSLGQLHRNGLPPGHAFAFDLKAGEVSEVLSDPTGHYIYKLDSKQVESFEKTSVQIHRTLKRQRKEKAIQAIQQRVATELNADYFGPAAKSDDPSK